MKRVFSLLLFFGLVSECNSQYMDAAASFTQSEGVTPITFKAIHFDNYHFDNVVLPPGYRMKKVGSSLTVGGAAIFIVGLVLVANSDVSTYNPNTGYYEPDSDLYLGSLMIVGGIGMMVPGIIFWVRGAKKYNRYLENLQGSVNFNGTGLSVRLKF